MKTKTHYEQLIPCLTEEGRVAYDSLKASGLDTDLALLLLEALSSPEVIYDLPVRHE